MNNMGKKLAIRGHRTRGAEVIKALEELGGKNFHSLSGEYESNIYFIGNNNEIHYTYFTIKYIDRFYQIYTLEEYLESLVQTEQKKSTNMEKAIAIRGHKDRGAEVIKILEELGGLNSHIFSGKYESNIYFIGNNDVIDFTSTVRLIEQFYQIYTLEEYLETLNQTEQIKSTNMEKVIEQKNDKTQRQLSVDFETAKQWYKTNNETLKQLALSLFTEEELTRIELPTSWEEFCEQNSMIDSEYYINNTSEINLCLGSYRESEKDKNLLETQEDAEAILALIQLKRLRDDWWKTLNYQADWTDNKEKYCICICNDEITFEIRSFSNAFLAFPTQESRNQFYTHFKDLILKAKPFLS